MNKTTLPTGMHDKLFKRARASYEIERTISDLLIGRGFNRIETPTIEHFEVFSDHVATDQYNFFGADGALLTLRPDVTSQIGRVIASTQVKPPIKFSYSGKVFRRHEDLRGLENESTQAGIELVGYEASLAVREAIETANAALRATGVTNYTFEFSHAKILQHLFTTLQLDEVKTAELKNLIANKNITGLYGFTVDNPSPFDAFIRELPYLFGKGDVVLERARQLTDDVTLLAVFDELEQVLRQEDDLSSVALDLAQVASMPYYNGLMFRVFDAHVPHAFLSGGRYDHLFERFGASDLTAVGWAIDIDAVYQAVYDKLTFEKGD